MKKKIQFTGILILILILISVSVLYSQKIKNSPIFIGHVFGVSSEKQILYKPLINVIDKNDLNYIIFGGDITYKEKDFFYFDSFFSNKKKLYIKGNHDGNLYEKINYWHKKKFKNYNIINLSNLTFEELMKFKYNNYNNTIFISHYNWFESLYAPHIVSNAKLPKKYSLQFKKIKNFGNFNKFIAGDCGKYSSNPPYVKIKQKSNQFICTGLGDSSNNYIRLFNLEPYFFNTDGKIIKHKCSEKKNISGNKIIFCSTKAIHLN